LESKNFLTIKFNGASMFDSADSADSADSNEFNQCAVYTLTLSSIAKSLFWRPYLYSFPLG
jgi:hypothetical protein